MPPAHLDVHEAVKPSEQHSFSLVDFLPDRIIVRQFNWDVKAQPPEAIDTLEPFYTQELVEIRRHADRQTHRFFPPQTQHPERGFERGTDMSSTAKLCRK